jgi:hypothetical protein
VVHGAPVVSSSALGGDTGDELVNEVVRATRHGAVVIDRAGVVHAAKQFAVGPVYAPAVAGQDLADLDDQGVGVWIQGSCGSIKTLRS